MDNDENENALNEPLSRLKRTACGLCRKRKLKCDGIRPTCATCSRLGHDCIYEEARKKSGPKRGYVKALEARLAQVETQLKKTDADGSIMLVDTEGNITGGLQGIQGQGVFAIPPLSKNQPAGFGYPNSGKQNNGQPFSTPGDPMAGAPNFNQGLPLVNPNWNAGDSYDPKSAPWDLLPTGLEEPLPSIRIINELTDLYFSKIHSYIPIIHRARFLMALAMPPNLQPPVALRYAMWSLASESSDRHATMSDVFYRRCRKYLELDEMRGFGESIVTVAHCQAWVLISIYEFKNMYFPRAWMSCGRAVRLAQMLGLHRVDGGATECKETLPPPKDWIEKEERRRTFWMAFWEDRCASIGTGWPMSVEEQDIHTNLPASEDAFQSGRPAPTQSLTQALQSSGSDLSGFAGAILLAAMLGRNLEHMHRTTPEDNESDLNGKYWTRHRDIDNILLNLTMGMPEMLRIPMGLPDPNVIFMNMCIHTAVICLHQSAMSRADKHQLTGSISSESKMRCVTAAMEIASIMRAIAHLDLSRMNPFMSFCLYVAARVFIQYLRARRNDARFQSSLSFVLNAMNAMKKKNALNEAFLAQLDVEMEACNLPRPTFTPTPGGAFSQIQHSQMHKNGHKAHGIAAGFESSGGSVINASSIGSSACDVGFLGSIVQVEEMADSPNGTTGSSGNSDYQSRIPPPGPFDPFMPDTNIGLSPQVSGHTPPVLTPGSTSNSDSNASNQNVYGQSRNANYSEQRQALSEHAPSFMYDAAATQPSMIGEFPGASNWQQTQTNNTNNLNTHSPAKAFTEMGAAEMDALFEMPTPSEFNVALGNTGMTPGVQDYGNMSYGQQTTIPVRNNGDTSTLTDTPGSWNMTGGTGMTPNFNDMSGVTDWDNLMDGLADWDPSQMNDGLIPSLD